MKYLLLTALIFLTSMSVTYWYRTDHRRYKRWEELGKHEVEYLGRCVDNQRFFTCIENIHEMRQIGVGF